MSISNCGSDERGKLSGGKAGDQTGKEYCVRSWYNRPWTCVLRHPTAAVKEKIATKARNAAENPNIGYDQNERLSFYNALKAVDWKPKNIKKKCEADCSASTSAIIIAVGHDLNNKKLKDVSPSNTTSTLKSALKNAGFKVLTDPKYLKSDNYLKPGDILLSEGHHVAINLTEGSKVKSTSKKTTEKKDAKKCPYKEPTGIVSYSSTGDDVKWVQWHLNQLLSSKKISAKRLGKAITKLTIDGIWKAKTKAVFKAFQKKYPATGTKGKPDGKCGPNSIKKLKALL